MKFILSSGIHTITANGTFFIIRHPVSANMNENCISFIACSSKSQTVPAQYSRSIENSSRLMRLRANRERYSTDCLCECLHSRGTTRFSFNFPVTTLNAKRQAERNFVSERRMETRLSTLRLHFHLVASSKARTIPTKPTRCEYSLQ